jgi:AcrR family transcriptional regulator
MHTPGSPTSVGGKRGRPRAAGADQRILRAALRLLARDGYDAMSVAGVATEAGVTKPTLYRRWSSKEELVIAAVSTLVTSDPADQSADLWARLVGELTSFHRVINRPDGIALTSNVLALEARHPELLKLYREQVVSVRRARIRVVLLEAQGRGLVRPDADIETALTMLIGYYYSARVGGIDINEQWPQRAVDLIRSGIEAVHSDEDLLAGSAVRDDGPAESDGRTS